LKIVCDIECNRLENPDKIWLIVCKELDTGKYHIFRGVTDDVSEKELFLLFAAQVTQWIGHNWLGYDGPVLSRLLDYAGCSDPDACLDTLILSKLIDYSREGHSIEQYGKEFGLTKGEFNDWSGYSTEMESYCIRDVDITELVYRKYYRYLINPNHQSSIKLEHQFQLVVNALHDNGFAFNTVRANALLERVSRDLGSLDQEITNAFPPKEVLVREFTPKATKYGTVSKTSVPRSLWDRIHEFDIGVTYPVYRTEEFNPSSHKQLIEVLTEANWKPVDKTTTHIKTERELGKLKRDRKEQNKEKINELELKLAGLRVSGYKINENNLNTLPNSAPAPARLLAKRILLESRRRTLTEWLSLVSESGRIHGRFYGIGAWTHRMAHQQPNTANIPNEYDTNNNVKLLGKEMRQLWHAPKNRLLVGVDAEGIQLRIFAHYIDDAEFTHALVNGKKEDKSDPHSLNQRILGKVCKSRQAAKRFIYALLLGAGLPKLAEILDCSVEDAREALERLLGRYEGFQHLKETIIPADAKRGWFTGIDGRRVAIPGDELGYRKHLAMSGYLQNGEQIIVKAATINLLDCLRREDEWEDAFRRHLCDALLCNIVHDEVIFEVPNDVRFAEEVSNRFSKCIEEVGNLYKLRCPLAGDGHVGLNWYEIH
jgi:DNA polymerase-1